MNIRNNRRTFLVQSGAALAMGALVLPARAMPVREGKPLIGQKNVVLFQCDSITDAGRSREEAPTPNKQPGMGNGYAWLAASQLLVDRPADSLQIFNRGISGNKVYQLAERWQADCLNLRPDVLSILIGVNDFWHMLDGKYNGTVEVYERDYMRLVQSTLSKLPGVKLVLCEPFVLRCGAVSEKWFPEFDKYRAAASRVASQNKTVWVPFQAIFDEAIKYAPPEHWAADGVHPSAAGASLMAHAWLKAVGM